MIILITQSQTTQFNNTAVPRQTSLIGYRTCDLSRKIMQVELNSL